MMEELEQEKCPAKGNYQCASLSEEANVAHCILVKGHEGNHRAIFEGTRQEWLNLPEV